MNLPPRNIKRLFNSIVEQVRRILKGDDVTGALERRYRTLLENALAGIYVVQDEQVIYANPKLAQIFGYQDQELIGMPFCALVAPEDHARIQRKFQERIS